MLWDPNKDKPVEVIDEVGELLSKTADYLETHRWCRNNLYNKGAVCMLGALIKVDTGKSPNNAILSGLVERAADRLIIHLNVHDRSIVYWNDVIAKSKKEVIEALRKASY